MEHHEKGPSNYNPWSLCVHYEGDGKESTKSVNGSFHHDELRKLLSVYDYDSKSDIAEWAYGEIESISCGAEVQPEHWLVGSVNGVAGIYGTADAVWKGEDGIVHIADLKSFSDMTKDYFPQLRGYAALMMTENDDPFCMVQLHVLHGGVKRVETITTDYISCLNSTIDILTSVELGEKEECINHYCQYCKHKENCKAMNNAITTVNNEVSFSQLSTVKKYELCVAIEKIIERVKEDAKNEAIENGGVIEDGDTRYEIKERAGKGHIENISNAAGLIQFPHIGTKNGIVDGVGLSGEQLLSLCDIPKTALAKALKDANANNKDIKKKDIDDFVSGLYVKGEPVKYLSKIS